MYGTFYFILSIAAIPSEASEPASEIQAVAAETDSTALPTKPSSSDLVGESAATDTSGLAPVATSTPAPEPSSNYLSLFSTSLNLFYQFILPFLF